MQEKDENSSIEGDKSSCLKDKNLQCDPNMEFTELRFMPCSVDSFFEINEVKIGRKFHWEQSERQRFNGQLLIRKIKGVFQAINIISLEDYLESVISSEMNPNAPLEFLKAHAVISRSWALSKIKKLNKENFILTDDEIKSGQDEIIRWYDGEGHEGYDVCADDHCQRYQGLTRIQNEAAKKAVKETEGMVLTYNGNICDARFSKCCGGAFETFENCWAPTPLPYLSEGRDWIFPPTEKSLSIKNQKTLSPGNLPENGLPDLTLESNAEKWIHSYPKSFCNTRDMKILREVLNDYDLSTTDFYRWEKEYTEPELREIIKEKSGIDFGEIEDIIPVERGVSGRLVKIMIKGSKKSMTIGKELEIRRILSPTHLYSSAFTIEKQNSSVFLLRGAGWGHGVGLCQIGAAVMTTQGYDFKRILSHYYPFTRLSLIQDL